MSEQKRLYRTTADCMLGGVAGGVARYVGTDPVLVRLGFMILSLFYGMGVMLYLIMWAVMPDEASVSLSGEDVIRANVEDIKQQVNRVFGRATSSTQGGTILAIALLVLGVMYLLRELIPGLPHGLLFPVLLIAIGAYLLFGRR